ncbi:MAG: hypothetical protein HY314_11365 [Acidobacteria bacterium]|nr:hypothetical protein [Acidobacteriota bacterium]
MRAHANSPHLDHCASDSDAALFNLGLALNQRINPKWLAGEKGVEILNGLLGSYLALGGMHLQWEIVDRATLLAAQERPEEYRDLVVRVAGYSALFADLSRAVQDEVISRMEHETYGISGQPEPTAVATPPDVGKGCDFPE